MYGLLNNNPLCYFDPLGLYLESFPGGPVAFWNDWTQQQRNDWFNDFNSKLGPIIDQAANRHCVPKELLSTIIANEMMNYSKTELILEKLGFGSSVGPGQITAGTVIRENVDGGSNRWPNQSDLRSQLIDPTKNIDIAAQLLRTYLGKLCSAAESGTMTASFRMDISPGCNLEDFCCRKGKSCYDAVHFNAPRCLIQALSAVWNNGPRLATEGNNIPDLMPNAYNNALWAGDLDGIFQP